MSQNREPDVFPNTRCYTTVQILSGQTDSDIFNLHGTTILGVIIPAAFSGTSLTIQAVDDAGTAHDVVNTAGTTILANTVAPGDLSTFDSAITRAIKRCVLVADSQAANRNLIVISDRL